jgi:hypothetical protein
MAGAADMPLLALEQPRFVAGMRGVAGNAAVIAVAHQMIMGRCHLFADTGMTFQAIVNRNRSSLAGMTILAAGRIRLVQDIADHGRTITAVRAVA